MTPKTRMTLNTSDSAYYPFTKHPRKILFVPVVNFLTKLQTSEPFANRFGTLKPNITEDGSESRERKRGSLLNSLSNGKILDGSRLKAFSDDKVKVLKKVIFVFDRLENILGKGKKCWLLAFSPFLSMFSKGFLVRVLKSPDCGQELTYVVKFHNLSHQH